MMQLGLMNRLRGRSGSSTLAALPLTGLLIPHVPLKYELIDWEVLEGCLNRIEYLNDNFNCYADPLITDLESCTANGKYTSDIIFDPKNDLELTEN